MRRSVALIITGLVALTATQVAGARVGHHPNRRALHFQRLAVVKERQLRRAQAKTRAARAENAALQSQLVSSQAETAGLRASLTQTQAALKAAQARADGLQARLDAIPTPLEAAEQYLDRVVWAATATDPARPRGEVVALAALDYVADNHVSLFMRSYLLTHGGLPSLTAANAILTAQAGLCGNAEIAFEALVRHFGFNVRRANFYYQDPPGTSAGHTAAEVYYGGAWHFFDPTFSVYWRDPSGSVEDITTVRDSGGIEQKNDGLLFNVIENPRDPGGGGVSDSWFETDPTTVVELLG